MGKNLDFDSNIFLASLVNIQNFRQNHPELVIKDCRRYGFTEEQLKIVRQSLLVRGVNKWLKVRRDLIAYKKQIKHQIQSLQLSVCFLKKETKSLACGRKQVERGEKSIRDLEQYYHKRIEYEIAKERLKTLNSVRAVLRELCNTDRWQVWEGKKLKDMNTLKASD